MPALIWSLPASTSALMSNFGYASPPSDSNGPASLTDIASPPSSSALRASVNLPLLTSFVPVKVSLRSVRASAVSPPPPLDPPLSSSLPQAASVSAARHASSSATMARALCSRTRWFTCNLLLTGGVKRRYEQHSAACLPVSCCAHASSQVHCFQVPIRPRPPAACW